MGNRFSRGSLIKIFTSIRGLKDINLRSGTVEGGGGGVKNHAPVVSVRMTDNCQPGTIQQRSIFRHDVGANSIIIWLARVAQPGKIERHPVSQASKKLFDCVPEFLAHNQTTSYSPRKLG